MGIYDVVFLLAAVPWFEIAAVIPLGILRGLRQVRVVVLALIGNLSTIILVVYLFERIRDYLVRKKGVIKEDGKRQERAKRIWNKYGFPGLALLGPILIGTHIAAFIGMSFGATKNWTLLWMTISLVIWSVLLGIAAFYGIETFKTLLG